MSWPKECKRTIDWSYFQNWGMLKFPWNQSFDVDDFCREHPEVEAAVIRFCWPSGVKDSRYDHYYDGFVRNGLMVMGYGWPNPRKTVKQVVDDWEAAMGDRVPKAIFGDWEDASTFENKSPAQLTDHMRALHDEKHVRFPSVVHGEYSRAAWLDEHIIASEFVRKLKWWLAHWIYPPPDFKDQASSFREIDAMLPIGNSFTPWRGRVIKIPEESLVGWQESSRMDIIPRAYSDGGRFKDSFLDPIFNDGTEPPIEPPIEPTEKAIVEVQVVQGEAEVKVI